MVLKIMVGEDTSFIGEAFPPTALRRVSASGAELDAAKTVLGNVEEGVAATEAAERYGQVNTKLGEDLSPDEMDKVPRSRRGFRTGRRGNAWDLDSRASTMDALRLRPGR
jgi:hypothetical protein